jgi:hypothetical protein
MFLGINITLMGMVAASAGDYLERAASLAHRAGICALRVVYVCSTHPMEVARFAATYAYDALSECIRSCIRIR